MKLPKYVTVGPFTVQLVCVPHELMYEVSEAQGTFVVKPPYKIYLDREMIQAGGPDAVNVVIHELLHLGFYQYHLKEKEEETIVNSYGNLGKERRGHSGLKEWIRFHTK